MSDKISESRRSVVLSLASLFSARLLGSASCFLSSSAFLSLSSALFSVLLT